MKVTFSIKVSFQHVLRTLMVTFSIDLDHTVHSFSLCEGSTKRNKQLLCLETETNFVWHIHYLEHLKNRNISVPLALEFFFFFSIGKFDNFVLSGNLVVLIPVIEQT